MWIPFLSRWLFNRSRKIFRFNDGRRVRAVDPVAAALALKEHPTYLRKHLFDSMRGDVDAQRIVAQAACDVFDVKPLDANGRGLSMTERIELVMGFDLYLSALKKNSVAFPTSPSSTVPTSEPSTEAITPATSASG